VADRRASTPTDAGKLVVPDMAEEVGRVEALRQRTWRCLHARLDQEQRSLDALRSRPALAAPVADLDRRAADIGGHVERARRCLAARLDGDHGQLQQLRARVGALSPAATLERGYAVLQKPDGTVVRDPAEVSAGETLTARVAGGRIGVRVTE